MVRRSAQHPAFHHAAPLPPLRACEICRHGRLHDGARVCTARAVAGSAAHVPVDDARRNHGACGPEAHHLDFPGLLG